MASPPPPAAAPSASMKTTALAPGFRFHPTDEELVSYYLKRKVSNKPVRFSAISEVDIYKTEPWDLADKSRLKSRDNEWYFFSALDRKYGNGARMNRATNKGYWKATGKDREVRRGSQTIAMKKTLVFHSGRAPGGQRTNWVMHEYRMVDEELEKIGGNQTDSYVLCRVFHKNNIGPPNGNRYAPFIEEEWDNGQTSFVPGEDAMDDVAPYRETYSERNRTEQDNHSITRNPLNINELPKDTENFEEYQREDFFMCKTEKVDDYPPCVLNTEAPFPVLQYKRRKPSNDIFSNSLNPSDNSTRTTQDRCSSTTSTAATTTTTDSTLAAANATTTAVSALLEFSQMGKTEPKERPFVPLDAASVHPSYVKFINDLQSEIRKISAERDSLKLEMMSVNAMMNILQSRIDFLSKENQDLKTSIGGDH